MTSCALPQAWPVAKLSRILISVSIEALNAASMRIAISGEADARSVRQVTSRLSSHHAPKRHPAHNGSEAGPGRRNG
jgi:hypothetical protein